MLVFKGLAPGGGWGPHGEGQAALVGEVLPVPVLVTFTPPQPLGLWLCGKKSSTEDPIGEEGQGGRVTDKVNLFPQPP